MTDMLIPIAFRFGSVSIPPDQMSFISIAYVVSCCLLFPWLIRRPSVAALRILSAVNIWLPLYSIFLFQQWTWFYQLYVLLPPAQINHSIDWYEMLDMHLMAKIILTLLPLLFLWKRWRSHRGLTFFLFLILLIYHPPTYWNLYNWYFHLIAWVSMLCISFSVFWLTRSFAHPSQEDV